MRTLIIALSFLFIAAGPAGAEPDPSLLVRTDDGNRHLFARPARKSDPLVRPGENIGAILGANLQGAPQIVDYARLYEHRCIENETDPALADFAREQCTCTAAMIPEIMTPADAAALFRTDDEGDYQYGRLMLEAHFPCLKSTLFAFERDRCLKTPGKNFSERVCACVGQWQVDYTQDKWRSMGIGLLWPKDAPGKKRIPLEQKPLRCDRGLARPAPLDHMINNHYGYRSRLKAAMSRCPVNPDDTYKADEAG